MNEERRLDPVSLRADLVALAWHQWAALGVTGWTTEETVPVDPEALIVLTAHLGNADARLRECATDWCLAFDSYVNETRLHSVAREVGLTDEARRFFATIKAVGGPLWVVSDAQPWIGYENRQKVHLTRLNTPGRTVLALRAMLGVSARADILTALTGLSEPVTVSELAARSRYTRKAVELALKPLALAGVVMLLRSGPRNTQVILAPDSIFSSWLLPGPAMPDWTSRITVALRVLSLAEAATSMPYPAFGVEARRLVRENRLAMIAAGLRLPSESLVGDAFTAAFSEWAHSGFR